MLMVNSGGICGLCSCFGSIGYADSLCVFDWLEFQIFVYLDFFVCYFGIVVCAGICVEVLVDFVEGLLVSVEIFVVISEVYAEGSLIFVGILEVALEAAVMSVVIFVEVLPEWLMMCCDGMTNFCLCDDI